MIRLENLTKEFPGGVLAVDDVSLHIEESETLVLIGLSGCGKTTTLKMVNRLIEPTSGRIFIAGQDVTHEDPVKLRRGIGYVIQDIGLFPHMTVGDNIAVVLRLTGHRRDARRARAEELLELVGLSPEEYCDRYPPELSGGEQQRVGVARALAADPPILLMDEPFGALDPITREQLQQEFRTLEEHIHKTIVLVTHDIFEAVLLGDRIGVMADGRIAQVATPQELLHSPASEFVERFLGQHRFQLQITSLEAADGALTGAAAAVRSLDASTPVGEARQHVKRHGLRAVVVQDRDQGVVGVVAATDIAEAAPPQRRLAELASDGAPTMRVDASVLDVVRAFTDSDTSFVPVVDAEERLQGIVTRASAAEAINRALGLASSEPARR
jgi:osmoprotectant transport system ATP-binding protein